MTTRAALRFVEIHGIVLESARGPLPNLVEAIAGEPVRGSWWAHPKAHAIYRTLGEVRECRDIATLRLLNGKVTLVHRRLWPALVRLEARLPREGLAAIREAHTPSGRHQTIETPFPGWVPAEIGEEAGRLSEADALTHFPEGFVKKCLSERKGAKRGRPARVDAPTR